MNCWKSLSLGCTLCIVSEASLNFIWHAIILSVQLISTKLIVVVLCSVEEIVQLLISTWFLPAGVHTVIMQTDEEYSLLRHWLHTHTHTTLHVYLAHYYFFYSHHYSHWVSLVENTSSSHVMMIFLHEMAYLSIIKISGCVLFVQKRKWLVASGYLIHIIAYKVSRAPSLRRFMKRQS